MSNTYKNDPVKYRLSYIFTSARSRCYNPKNHSYKDYGGRGIKMEWDGFISFYNDMVGSYHDGLTLDRINNDGNYSKENCRWATREEQSYNKRNTKLITHKGFSLTLVQWAKKLGVPKTRLFMRYYAYKWPVERVLNPNFGG